MEKSMKKYAFVAAALLAAPIALTSCSSDDEAADVNPTFDGNSVKTQFAINVPHAGNTGTRMTDVNTQINGNFLGITDVRLIPFSSAITGSSAITNTIISLGDISGLSADQSSKIYSDVNVPVGTSHFLFYGRANGGDDAFANGKLTATIDGQANTSDISFALNNVLAENATVSDASLLAVLTAVATVDGWSTSMGDLKNLYDAFITLKAGSANSIKATLEALYNSVNDFNTGEGSIGAKIQEAIITGTDKNPSPFTVSGTAPDATLSTTNNFPKNLNLPDGAVTVKFENNAFTYNTLDGIGGTDNKVDVKNITYPASLYYWVATDVKTTDTEVAENDWPKTTELWSTKFGGNDWTGTSVTATTRAIALKENINYGVANLALTAKCAKDVLQDTPVGDDNFTNNIAVPDGGIPVTAVLVGGQPTSCDYSFAPSGTYTKTVYDKVTGGKAAYNASEEDLTTNYTLLLPIAAPSEDGTNGTVNFALELTNNTGVEFHGANGQIIPKNGTFYLVGQLDMKNAVKPDGVTAIFMSDYTTTATVNISSLANAYNTIPDLRAAGLQLGLSVDLEWKKGVDFDVTID